MTVFFPVFSIWALPEVIYLDFHSWQRASLHSASARSATYTQNGTDCCVKAHPELDPWSVFRSMA